MSEPGKYYIEMVCGNCGHKFTKWLPKGTKVKVDIIECTRCGCAGTSEPEWSRPKPPIYSVPTLPPLPEPYVPWPRRPTWPPRNWWRARNWWQAID